MGSSVVSKSKNSKFRSLKILELLKFSKKQYSSVITNLFDYETEKNIRTKRLARFYEKLISDMSKRNKKNFVQTLISSEASNINKNFQVNKDEVHIRNLNNVFVTSNNDDDQCDRTEKIFNSNNENQVRQYSNDWKNRIRRRLAEQSERKTFDIQQQGKELMLKLSKITIVNQKFLKKNHLNNEKESQYEQQQIPLMKLFEGKPK